MIQKFKRKGRQQPQKLSPEEAKERQRAHLAWVKSRKITRAKIRSEKEHKVKERQLRHTQRMQDKEMKQSHIEAAEYYLQGMTKKEALARAGYSEKLGPKVVFGRRDVLQYLEDRRKKLRSRTHDAVDRIQEELMRVAFFNIGKLIEIDEETGELLYNFEDATMEDFAALGEVSVEVTGKGKYVTRKVRVRPYNKLEALNALGRIYGIMQDNLNLTTGKGESIEDRLAAGRKRLNKAAKSATIEGEFTRE